MREPYKPTSPKPCKHNPISLIAPIAPITNPISPINGIVPFVGLTGVIRFIGFRLALAEFRVRGICVFQGS